ncbi:MAG: hypothetical protein WDO69_10370 [Pseudomonadota bacterium]
MRHLLTSFTLAGFTAAVGIAGLAGCGSDAPTPPPTGTPPAGTSGAAGTSATAGSGPGSGGNSSVGAAGGGGTGVVGTAGSGPGGSTAAGTGGTSTAGSSATGGAPGGSGSGGTITTGGSGPDVDQMGKANAKPGDMTSVAMDYLRMGEIRLINNNWGAKKLGCNATESVFINADKSFGWNFNRGACGGSNQDPDFPEVEFGIHPFGLGSSDATSPNFSTTTLLPLQIKDITSASVTIDGLSINLQNASSWDLTFEFWLSQQNPAITKDNAGVYSELMTFWGWQDGRYPEKPNGTGPIGTGAGDQVKAGDKTYKLEVQDDNWAGGKWRYFQFRTTDGPLKSFSGTVDVKAMIDYLVTKRMPGYSKDLWVARLEVGSEIDDNTSGTVTMKKITFEVNKQTRTPVFSQ